MNENTPFFRKRGDNGSARGVNNGDIGAQAGRMCVRGSEGREGSGITV